MRGCVRPEGDIGALQSHIISEPTFHISIQRGKKKQKEKKEKTTAIIYVDNDHKKKLTL